MDYSQWPSGINTKFFDYTAKPKENTQNTTFLSGRTISYQNNTKKIMIHSFSVDLTKVELELFWIWFNDTLGQTATPFTCSALGNKLYRFSSIPELTDADQTHKVLNIEIEDYY